MWGVPLEAGLPSGARAEVVPENSLRGPKAAPFKHLRQVCQRCALRAPTSTLRSSAPTRRPAGRHPSPLRPACGVPRARDRGVAPAGQKSRVGGWRGACVGVAGTQAGPGLPLAFGKGMASMSEPAGRVAQPPGLDKVPKSSPAQRDRPHEALPATDSAPPRALRQNEKPPRKAKKSPGRRTDPGFGTTECGWRRQTRNTCQNLLKQKSS